MQHGPNLHTLARPWVLEAIVAYCDVWIQKHAWCKVMYFVISHHWLAKLCSQDSQDSQAYSQWKRPRWLSWAKTLSQGQRRWKTQDGYDCHCLKHKSTKNMCLSKFEVVWTLGASNFATLETWGALELHDAHSIVWRFRAGGPEMGSSIAIGRPGAFAKPGPLESAMCSTLMQLGT